MALYGLIAYILLFFITKYTKHRAITILLIFAIALILGYDLHIRYSERYKDYRGYLELNGSMLYVSIYQLINMENKKYVSYYPPNSKMVDKKTDFTITYSYNNMGLRGLKNIEMEREPGEYRILTIGDSYTEGVGARDGFTWPEVLERELKSRFQNGKIKKINVINAGKGGNDPIQCAHSFKTHYVNWKPNMIILSINNSDVHDVYTRGGNNRFIGDHEILRKGPWWEIFYGASFIVRKFVREELNYTRYLISRKDEEAEKLFSRDEILKAVQTLNDLCKQKGIDLVLVITPNQYEMERIMTIPNGMRNEDGLLDGLGLIYEELRNRNYKTIFLPICYHKRMTDLGTKPVQYYWKHDFHHNEEGYKMYAECVSEQLNRRYDEAD